MLKRLIKAYRLVREAEKRSPDGIVVLSKSTLTPEQLAAIEQPGKIKAVEGDGKAEFFGEPTPAEELEFQREQDGTLPWYKRILK